MSSLKANCYQLIAFTNPFKNFNSFIDILKGIEFAE